MEPLLNRTLQSTAKVNLYLDILGKDPADSYHYIDSIFQEISLSDRIEITSSDRDEVIFHPDINTQNTTVHKALSGFKQLFGVADCFSIHVRKNIPMGAGLGGGSSNAASVLMALADHYHIEHTRLYGLATRIGSDVPFFLKGGMAHVWGKGESLEAVDARLDNMTFLVIYPGVHVSTPWAYSLVDEYGDGSGHSEFMKISEIKFDFLLKIVYNRFQHFVLKSLDSIHRIKQELDGIVHTPLSFMSGSGSSLVYVYADQDLARVDRELIKTTVDHPLFLCRPVYR